MKLTRDTFAISKSQRVRSGVIRRMICKICKRLHAGVMQSCAERHPDRGTSKGGVVTCPPQEVILESGSLSCRTGLDLLPEQPFPPVIGTDRRILISPSPKSIPLTRERSTFSRSTTSTVSLLTCNCSQKLSKVTRGIAPVSLKRSPSLPILPPRPASEGR